jgi:hypothetical protein
MVVTLAGAPPPRLGVGRGVYAEARQRIEEYEISERSLGS